MLGRNRPLYKGNRVFQGVSINSGDIYSRIKDFLSFVFLFWIDISLGWGEILSLMWALWTEDLMLIVLWGVFLTVFVGEHIGLLAVVLGLSIWNVGRRFLDVNIKMFFPIWLGFWMWKMEVFGGWKILFLCWGILNGRFIVDFAKRVLEKKDIVD